MDVRLDLYAKSGTTLTEPRRIGEFSGHASSSITCDRSNLRHLKEFDGQTYLNFDLDSGFDTWIQKDPNKYRNDLRELQLWAAKWKSSSNAKEAFDGADVVCVRGALTTIATTPCNNEKGWRMVAVSDGGVIYLHDCAVRDGTRFAIASSPHLAHCMYWGFKFEQYMTTDEEHNYDTSSPIDCRETYYAVLRADLMRRGRNEPLRLAYAAEMDAVDKIGRFVELKTMKEEMYGQLWNPNEHKWWMQSTLSGIDRIVVGLRNQSGVVKQLNYINKIELDLLRMSDVMLTFLSAVLSEIERKLETGGSLQIRYDPGDQKVHFETANKQEKNIFIDEFRKLL